MVIWDCNGQNTKGRDVIRLGNIKLEFELRSRLELPPGWIERIKGTLNDD